MQMLAERVMAGLGQRLAPHGWSAVEPADDDEYASFVRQGGDGISFELGLDLSPREYGLSLNPTLGVRHREVDRLARQFYGLSAGACQVGTGLADLLYQAGRDEGPLPRWIVRSPEEAGTAADLVHADLEEYGSPFLARFSTVEDVVAALAAAERSQQDNGHLAIAYALTGQMSQALEVLAEFTAEAARQPPFVAEQSHRFIRAFHDHFGT